MHLASKDARLVLDEVTAVFLRLCYPTPHTHHHNHHHKHESYVGVLSIPCVRKAGISLTCAFPQTLYIMLLVSISERNWYIRGFRLEI